LRNSPVRSETWRGAQKGAPSRGGSGRRFRWGALQTIPPPPPIVRGEPPPRGGEACRLHSGGAPSRGGGAWVLRMGGTTSNAPSAPIARGEPPAHGGRMEGFEKLASSLGSLGRGAQKGAPSRGGRGRGFDGGHYRQRPRPPIVRKGNPPRGGEVPCVVWPRGAHARSHARRGHHVTFHFSNNQVPKMSPRVWTKWPTLYGDFAVHGPPPYKNCPPQHFLATSTALWIFTPQMGSVSLCRSDPGPTARG
jgi:hypothetical protein